MELLLIKAAGWLAFAGILFWMTTGPAHQDREDKFIFRALAVACSAAGFIRIWQAFNWGVEDVFVVFPALVALAVLALCFEGFATRLLGSRNAQEVPERPFAGVL